MIFEIVIGILIAVFLIATAPNWLPWLVRAAIAFLFIGILFVGAVLITWGGQ